MGFSIGGLVNKITGADDAATAARDAATIGSQAQTEMFDKSLAFQREQWDYQKNLQQPWLDAGKRGLAGYEGLLNDPWSVRQDPGYQFGLSEGLRGLEGSAAARGMGLSGNTLKGITGYSQDYASTKYGEALNRQMGLANFGTGATSQLMQGSAEVSRGVANAMGAQGQQLAGYHQSMGQIGAQEATAGFNTLMGVGSLAASAYGAGMFGGMGGGAGGGAGFMAPQNSAGSMNIGFRA